MKFSAIALIALSGVEAARLHTLERAQARAELEAMSEQMEALSQNMKENQQSLAEMKNWWDSVLNFFKT